MRFRLYLGRAIKMALASRMHEDKASVPIKHHALISPVLRREGPKSSGSKSPEAACETGI